MSVTIKAVFQTMAASGKAICVKYNDESIWLPVSQIEDSSCPYDEMSRGAEVELVLSDWIAKQKNITMAENYEARAATGTQWTVIHIPTGNTMCVALERNAHIIAAALNMTEGKL